MTQRVDGGELCRAARGVDAGHEADADGHRERSRDGPPHELDGLVDQVGVPNYLQAQMGTPS